MSYKISVGSSVGLMVGWSVSLLVIKSVCWSVRWFGSKLVIGFVGQWVIPCSKVNKAILN